MKKLLLKIICLLVFATPVSAQINLIGGMATPTTLTGKTESFDTPQTVYYKTDYQVELDTGFLLGIEYQQNLFDQIGFSTGIVFAPAKKFLRSSNSLGSKSTGDGKAFMDIMTFYGNLTYDLNPFYFFGGLNMNALNLRYNDYSNFNTVLVSGIGYQLGAGFRLTDQLTIEATYWSVNAKTSSTTSGYNYGSSYTNVLDLSTNYLTGVVKYQLF